MSFSILARLLHWVMAVAIIAMLFIGIGMVASLDDYHWLLSIHRPLGILILILAAIRLLNRLLIAPAPSLPAGMPAWQRAVAHGSHWVLYALMFAVPLVGWAMLSAGGFPIPMFGAFQLPPILGPSPMLYATLRQAHTLLALSFFAVILLHLAAGLMHALVYRDDVFASMTVGVRRR